MPKTKRVSSKTVKAWTLVDENGEMLGTGQGSFEYFYTKKHAQDWQKEMSTPLEGASQGVKFIRNIFAKWKVVPITITYTPKK